MTEAATHKPPHPSLYLLLFLPFGITSGYATVTLSYLLSQGGATVAAVAGVVGMSYLPNTWKVLWAPLVDTTLSPKKWYLISVGLSAASFAGCAFLPYTVASLPAFGALMFIMGGVSTFLAMSVERLMAYDTPEEQKGRAGGWSQAGNLGGQGLGGGLSLWLIESGGFSSAASGAMLGLLCVLCCAALLWVDDSKPLLKVEGHLEIAGRKGVAANLRAIGGDLWELLRSRIGILALLICLLPIGSGAAQNLWSPIADEWHASADVVAFVTGAMSGLISALGCLAGGWLCDRIDRKAAYCLFGFLLCLAAVGMALCPRTSNQYVFWTSTYAFGVGLCYAAYCAVVLEAIGKTAAATKFSFLSAVSNSPIMAMTFVDGWAQGRWGTNGMLWTEAAIGAVGIVVFAAMAAATKRPAAPALANAA